MARNILVTGAAGFLGRHVARACALAGCTVRGIGHGSWPSSEWRNWGLSEWYESDVTFEALVSYGGEPDMVVHCAGSGSVGFSMLHPAQDFDRTVVTVRDVLEYVRLNSPQAGVVLPSSASVYGNAPDVPISVSAPLAPVSPYGQHKLMAEELCLSYARHFEVPVAIVRLFSVYGVGLQKQLLWDACKKLSLGPAVFSGTGREMRDWLHVEDAARFLYNAGQQASPSGLIVNGATGVGVSTRSIVEAIARGFDRLDNVEFSGVGRSGDPAHLIADISKAQVLDWHPQKSLEAELERYVEWFKETVF